MISTSSSAAKLAVAKSLGATHLINYTSTPDWAGEVFRLTNEKGVDHVIDVAGAGTIEQSLQSTKHGGLVSVIGCLSGSKQADLIPAVLYGAKTIRGVFGVRRNMKEEMVRFIEEHKIHPQIAKVYGWREAREAFEALVKQESIGKIVVRVGDE